MFDLLFQRRFLPFFICQFCGAFTDSIFRLALVSMLAFGVFKSEASGIFIALSAAVFMLPFLFFSAAAGEITDSMSKRRLLIAVKSAEVLVMGVAAAAVYWQSLPLALLCLFLTGTQSAFFGPIKYSLLPALLNRGELLNGNAWFSVSTFAAILGGTVFGTVAGKSPQLAVALCGGLVALSAIGLAAAVLVPVVDDSAPAQRPRFAPLQSFATVLAAARADKKIFLCILAGSWFWLVGAMLLNELAQMPYEIYTQLLVAVLLGVGIGAALCHLLFRGVITTKYAPLTLFISAVLLFYISWHFDPASGETPLALAAAVVLLAATMTLYVVPLRTTVQALAAASVRAKVIAVYNIFNALFIVVAAVIAACLHVVVSDNPSQAVLALTCLLSLIGSLLVWRVVPLETARRVLVLIFRLLFRVRVRGIENLQGKSTLICNHQSFLDGLLLAVFLQDEQRHLGFAVDVEQAKRFIVRQALKLVRSYSLNPMEPQRVRTLIREIQNDKETIMPLIFPEGRITVTGNLMKCYPGAGVIAQKISAGKVTPIIINGLQYSTMSRMQGKLRLRWFPPVTIDVFPPQQLTAPPALRGGPRRQWLATQMSYMLEQSLFSVLSHDVDNLTVRYAAAAERFGSKARLFSEFPTRQLTYRQVFTAAHAIGSVLRRQYVPDCRIGLLLPSSVGAAVCFYAALFQRLVPVMLNPSVGTAQALSSCKTATLETVYTSELLLQRSPPTAQIVKALQDAGIKVIMLETLRGQITLSDRLKAGLAGLFLQRSARRLPGYQASSESYATVLFTSGSEGVPKGVVLSHRNLIINSAQVMSRVAVTQQDIMLNALPVFHSFGLFAGVVLPVMAGAETWQYPSPLHYKMVPEALYASNATIFFGANTFLSNYGKFAHPLDLWGLRLVFAGAEKLRDDTRRLWMEKFGVRLLEGYGVTETAPVLSINTPLYNLPGSVGRLVSGVEARVEPVPDIAQGGRLWVRGGNIMAGYFTAAAPGELKPPPDGWHDTGDIVEINEEDYITIKGRAKRFIKIAGEMVPLDSVEECLKKHCEGLLAVIGVADARRGEALALMSTVEISAEAIAAALRQAGLPELWQPRHLRVVQEMPLLSTGKIDYPGVAKLFDS